METLHQSVLMEEVMEHLAIAPSDVVLDATLGGAGHFGRFLAALGAGGTLIGIDADPEAVERAREVVALDRRPERPVVHLINDNFRNLSRILDRLEIGQFDKALFDLGWSGYQLAAKRGFSFAEDEPLLMTYSSTDLGGGGERSAAEIVNSSSEQELADILYTFGEEHFSREIARAIVLSRKRARILSTTALTEAVKAATPAWYQRAKLHPATKTFQALRIAANDELGALAEALSSSIARLAPSGRLAVISFHSIEDRIVKQALKEAAERGLGTTLKKPIGPGSAELARNRRARSAKLRVFERNSSSAGALSPSSLPMHAYA